MLATQTGWSVTTESQPVETSERDGSKCRRCCMSGCSRYRVTVKDKCWLTVLVDTAPIVNTSGEATESQPFEPVSVAVYVPAALMGPDIHCSS